MKKILFLVLFTFYFFASAQRIPVDAIRFQGKVTSTIRDGFNVPTGEHWLIYNVTTDQLEVGDEDENWTAALGGGGSDNLGNHLATQDLDLDDNDILNVGDIAAVTSQFTTMNATNVVANNITVTTDVEINGDLLLSTEGLQADPTDTEPTANKGAIYFDDSESTLKQYNGSAWEALNGSGGSSAPVTLATYNGWDNSTKIANAGKSVIDPSIDPGPLGQPSIVTFTSSRDVAETDVQNKILCTTSSTLTITEDFDEMPVGAAIILIAKATIITIIADTGVTLNDVVTGTEVVGNGSANASGSLEKIGTNEYLLVQ